MVMFWGSLFTVSSWMVTLQWSCQICINNAKIQKQGTVNVFFAMHSNAVIPSFAWKESLPSALFNFIFTTFPHKVYYKEWFTRIKGVIHVDIHFEPVKIRPDVFTACSMREIFSCQWRMCSDVHSHNLPTFMLPYFALPLEEIFDHWSQYVLVSKETRKWKCC